MKDCPLWKIFLYMSLVLLVVCLVNPPIVIAEESSQAVCPGGRTVSCKAHRCVCVNNSGCTGFDSQGNIIVDNPCPARNTEQLEEGPIS